MKGIEWNGVDDEAKDFVSRLMTYDAKERVTAGEALKD